MAIVEILQQNFARSLERYADLAAVLPEAALAMRLPGIRSNTVGSQLWCVVGARESYVRAVEAGRWTGFACSLTSEGARDKAAVQAALVRSAEAVRAAARGWEAYDDARSRLLADLLEHEAAHQGQLIRYLYGLALPIPDSWKTHHALR